MTTDIRDASIAFGRFVGPAALWVGFTDFADAAEKSKTAGEKLPFTGGNRLFSLPPGGMKAAREQFEEEWQAAQEALKGPVITPEIDPAPVEQFKQKSLEFKNPELAGPLLRGSSAEITARFSDNAQMRERIRLLNEQIKRQNEMVDTLHNIEDGFRKATPLEVQQFGF